MWTRECTAGKLTFESLKENSGYVNAIAPGSSLNPVWSPSRYPDGLDIPVGATGDGVVEVGDDDLVAEICSHFPGVCFFIHSLSNVQSTVDLSSVT
jgi:hypothetical protein